MRPGQPVDKVHEHTLYAFAESTPEARLGEGRLRLASAHTQFGDFLARLGLRREHAGTLHREN